MRIPDVELSECSLCEVCIEVCPSVFRLNDAGYIEVAQLSNYPEYEVAEAMKNCVSGCIYWQEI